jgi:hypothetical protein
VPSRAKSPTQKPTTASAPASGLKEAGAAKPDTRPTIIAEPHLEHLQAEIAHMLSAERRLGATDQQWTKVRGALETERVCSYKVGKRTFRITLERLE